MIALTILLAALSLVAPARLMSANAAEKTPARTIVVEIEGLACPFCVYGLERQFNRLEGVERAKVDLGQGKAELKLKPGATVTEAAIREAVRKAGFKASEIRGIKEQGGGESRPLAGTIERSGERFILVTPDGTKYLLFDQDASEAQQALKESTRKALDRFADGKTRVRIRGAVHEHKGMPRGLKVDSVEKAP